MHLIIRLIIATFLVSGMIPQSLAQVSPSPTTETPTVTTSPAPNTATPAPSPAAPAKRRELGTMTSGDYRFRLASESSAGWYVPQNGQLIWMNPQSGTNAHLEVFLTNAVDSRPLPDAKMTLTIIGSNGKVIAAKPMVFLWHPDGYHYGNDFAIPTAGSYTVRVCVTQPPMFARHNKVLGKRFFTTPTVTFTNVQLRPEGVAKE